MEKGRGPETEPLHISTLRSLGEEGEPAKKAEKEKSVR